MELLTGQCKKDFKKWLDYDFWDKQQPIIIPDHYSGGETSIYPSDHLNTLHLSMQWGVLVDFFDSVGIIISLYKDYNGFHWCIGDRDNHDGDTQKGWGYLSDFRSEARTESIKKSNELYNERHLNNIEVQHEEIKKDEKQRKL